MNQRFIPINLLAFCLNFLLFYNPTIGQNLVVNPSFENIVNCPTALERISDALLWSSPTAATADYFHECDNSNVAGIPANSFGFQSARTGSAYGGVQTYSTTSNVDYREYLQIPLINPMIADSIYSVNFYVSPADNVNDCFTDAIGAILTSGQMNESQQTTLTINPVIENVSGNFLTDKGNWLLISGFYTAQGGEDHLIIGSFQSDAETATETPCGNDAVAYYYVDDVSVELLPQLAIIGDNFICQGENVELEAVNRTNVEWISNANLNTIISTFNTLTVSPTETTTYTVFSDAGESASITVTVQEAPIVNLTETLNICPGTPINLDATPSNINDPVTYSWQDNSSLPTFSAETAGTYTVQLEVNGCTFTESVELTDSQNFDVNFGAEVLEICEGSSLILNPQPSDAIVPNLNFLWQDGSTNFILEVSNSGVYSVEGGNECFTKTDEVTVEETICDCFVTFPTAFSPNEDGINDDFRPVSNCELSNYQLTIYSRFGNEVFKSTDATQPWDGRIDLENADQKVYTWVAKYQVSSRQDFFGEDVVQSGSVLLLR